MQEKLRYQHIYEDLKASIDSGRLQEGDRLQPVTELALHYQVTIATVRRALADLVARGLVSSHVGRGTFVTRPASLPKENHAAAGLNEGSPGGSYSNMDAFRSSPRRSGVQDPQAALSGLMALAQDPRIIAFTRGMGDPLMIDKGILTRYTLRALSEGEELFWDHGDPRGLPGLRSAIARLYSTSGFTVHPDQILVTSGSQQALYLLAQQARENRMYAVCETPCYAGVTTAFGAFGLDLLTLPRDSSGPDTSRLGKVLARGPGLVYVCPFLHNPMGTDLAEGKRDEILSLARASGSLVVSDEVFRDLHPGSESRGSLLPQMGEDGGVVLGSLSKSFISGLRVGWIAGDRERIQDLARIKKSMDLGCPPLMQGIAQAFLEDPEGYHRHRERIARHYLDRRDAALQALEKFMPGEVTWTIPEGGFQLWVSLPEHMSSIDLYLKAIESGAAFLPGPLQDVSGGSLHCFRLCYGSLDLEAIHEGIARIAKAVRAMLDAPVRMESGLGMGDF